LQTMDARPLLTPLEVADRLAMSRATVYRLCEAEVIPAKRIGGQWRIDGDELDRWLARC
jgi:excisionase family DNA binding protein